MATLNIEIALPPGAAVSAETAAGVESVFNRLVQDVVDMMDRDFAPVSDSVERLLDSGAVDADAGLQSLLHGVTSRSVLRSVDRLCRLPDFEPLSPVDLGLSGWRLPTGDIGSVTDQLRGPSVPPIVVWVEEGGEGGEGGEDADDDSGGFDPFDVPERSDPNTPRVPGEPNTADRDLEFEVALDPKRKQNPLLDNDGPGGLFQLEIFVKLKLKLKIPDRAFDIAVINGLVGAAIGGAVAGFVAGAAAVGGAAVAGAVFGGILAGFAAGALVVGAVYLVYWVGKKVVNWLKKIFGKDEDSDSGGDTPDVDGLIWLGPYFLVPKAVNTFQAGGVSVPNVAQQPAWAHLLSSQSGTGWR